MKEELLNELKELTGQALEEKVSELLKEKQITGKDLLETIQHQELRLPRRFLLKLATDFSKGENGCQKDEPKAKNLLECAESIENLHLTELGKLNEEEVEERLKVDLNDENVSTEAFLKAVTDQTLTVELDIIHKIADCFYRGTDVGKDVKRALALFKYAADCGHSISAGFCSHIYFYEEAGEANYQNALTYSLKAAADDNSEYALLSLIYCKLNELSKAINAFYLLKVDGTEEYIYNYINIINAILKSNQPDLVTQVDNAFDKIDHSKVIALIEQIKKLLKNESKVDKLCQGKTIEHIISLVNRLAQIKDDDANNIVEEIKVMAIASSPVDMRVKLAFDNIDKAVEVFNALPPDSLDANTMALFYGSLIEKGYVDHILKIPKAKQE